MLRTNKIFGLSNSQSNNLMSNKMPKVFVSYSRKDSRWVVPTNTSNDPAIIPWLRDKFLRHPSEIEFWWDAELDRKTGNAYDSEIQKAIEESKIAILLVSDNFFISKYIMEMEFPSIRERVDSGDMQLFPIVVGHVDWGQCEESAWLYRRHIHPSAITPLIKVMESPAKWDETRTNLSIALREQILGMPTMPPDESGSANIVTVTTNSGSSGYANQTVHEVAIDGSKEYNSIQAAVEASSSGDIVKIYPGEYHENIMLSRNVSLIGSDRDSCMIIGQGDHPAIYAPEDCTGIIEGLTLIGQDLKREIEGLDDLEGLEALFEVTKSSGLVTKNSSITIRNCSIKKFPGLGGVFIGNGQMTFSQSSFIENELGGMGFYLGSSGELDNMVIKDNGKTGLNVIGAGCRVSMTNSECSTNGASGIEVTNGAIGHIEKCQIHSNTQNGLFCLGEISELRAIKNIIRQNDIGIMGQDGSKLFVEKNECSENNVAGMMLAENGVEGTLTGNLCNRNKKYGIIALGDCNITATSNVCSENEDNGFLVKGEVVALSFVENQIFENKNAGIYLVGGISGKVQSNEINRNAKDGLVVVGAPAELEISRNYIKGNESFGIFFVQGSRAIALGNKIENNADGGILIAQEGTEPTLKENTCRRNGGEGIKFKAGSHGLVIENKCLQNDSAGIVATDEDTQPRIVENQCEENDGSGIIIFAGAEAIVEKNICERNEGGGILVAKSGAKAAITGNECHDNHGAGIGIFDSGSAVAEMNECDGNKGGGIEEIGEGSIGLFRENKCTYNKNFGLAFYDGGQGKAESCTIENNERYGIFVCGPSTRADLLSNSCVKNEGFGICFSDAIGLAEENVCEKNTSGGMIVTGDSANPVLRKNRCSENEASGITFMGGASGEAEENECEYNESGGIAIIGPDTCPTLLYNSCVRNQKGGIGYSNGSGGLAKRNRCNRNGLAGILVMGAGTNPTLKNNRGTGNDPGGIYVEDDAGACPRLEGNSF